jgi:hypothetical protein
MSVIKITLMKKTLHRRISMGHNKELFNKLEMMDILNNKTAIDYLDNHIVFGTLNVTDSDNSLLESKE